MSKDLLEKLRIVSTKTSYLYELYKDKNLKQLPNNVLSPKIIEILSQFEKSIEHINKN
jgi:hypothetical protein